MIRKLITRLTALTFRDEGQDMIEYALLASLIVLAAVAALGSVGDTLNEIWWQPISGNLGQR